MYKGLIFFIFCSSLKEIKNSYIELANVCLTKVFSEWKLGLNLAKELGGPSSSDVEGLSCCVAEGFAK